MINYTDEELEQLLISRNVQPYWFEGVRSRVYILAQIVRDEVEKKMAEKIKISNITNLLVKHAATLRIGISYDLVSQQTVLTAYKKSSNTNVPVVSIRKSTLEECIADLDEKVAKGDIF